MTCVTERAKPRRSPRPDDLAGTLMRYLSYCASTGEVVILPRSEADFIWHKNPAAYARWFNENKAGKSAYMSPYPNGYLRVACCGQAYLGHRVAWILATGKEPTGVIDHINGVRSDNRLINLRDVSLSENSANHGKYCTSPAGITGVSYNARADRWIVRFIRDGKTTPARWFRTKEEAVSHRILMGHLPRGHEGGAFQ